MDIPVPQSVFLLPDAKARLEALSLRIKEDVNVTKHQRSWIPRPESDDANVLDVLIIGGGQAGLGVAFAMKRENIDRVLVVDEGDDPNRIGPWKRYARMHTLRSPKHMKGIELDVPSLHVQRWFEACYGENAWKETNLIPRVDWNDYLVFYRWVTGVQVRHQCKVTGVHKPESCNGPFLVTMNRTDIPDVSTQETVMARRVVFAMGLIGGGAIHVPTMIQQLPKRAWCHTEEEFDFSKFKDKRVAVLGAGASGFDNAGTALEAGASHVKVFMRRQTVPRSNPLRWMEFPGMQEHYYDLTDEQKLEFSLFNNGLPQPPTQHTIWRCYEHPNFELRSSEQWTDIIVDGNELIIQTRNKEGDQCVYSFDYIIAATGYKVDLSLRPELKEFLNDIKCWKEAYPPSANTPVATSPYLGPGFEFTPRDGAPAWISRLYHFSTGARASMGVSGNQLSGIYGGIKRMAWSIATSITRENWNTLMKEFKEFEHIEVTKVGPHTDSDYPYASGPSYCSEKTLII